MLSILVLVFCLGNTVFLAQGSPKSRCAVVIFFNKASFSSDADFSKSVQNIQGLTVNNTNVYFSDDPDTFKVKHGAFIDAPGLFALESKKYPGMFLRRENHTIVLQHERSTDTFKNDATFLMDNPEQNQTYTSLKLFSHRSWKLFSFPDSKDSLIFDIPNDNKTSDKGFGLLVVAQSCMHNDTSESKVIESSKPKVDIKEEDDGSVSAPKPVVTNSSISSDPTLNPKTDAKYLTAVTNKGNLKSISNEYSFENFKVPDFIMHYLMEDAKNAGDGMEAPTPESHSSASIVSDNNQQQQPTIEHETKLPTTKQKINELSSLIEDPDMDDKHETKLPTTKQKISELSSLIEDPDMDDLVKNLNDLQYGSKGCKLLVAEDTIDEDAVSKDSVTRPKKNRECVDEFPDSCKEMSDKGYCLAFKSLMSSVCRKSCNLCSSLVDTGFTSCTKRCGGGRQMRMIKIHRREYLQTRRCNSQPCPVDGGYSEFGSFTECSTTCGKGVKYRRRTCTRPRPQFNGRSCRRQGPSIESKDCDAGPCPRDRQHDKHHGMKKKHSPDSEHHKVNLHIDGPHSDKVHEHLVLLKGKKVAKLRCTPRKGQLRSVIQDALTKRFVVHYSNKKHNSKKSDIEEGEVLFNHDGLPVDTASTVVKAFKSPYKIILSRKGAHNMKLLEECLESDLGVDVENESADDDDKSVSDDDRSSELETVFSDDSKKIKKQHKHERSNQVYEKPGEKSYSDFDEYKYEAGNIVTPQVTTSPADYSHDYASPRGKLFDENNGLDSFLDKMNAPKPRIDEQLSNEQDLESSFNTENGKSMDAPTFNNEGGGIDSSSHPGFAVTTIPDNPSMQPGGNSGNKDTEGYNVESVPDR